MLASSTSGEMDTMKKHSEQLGKWGKFREIFPFLSGWEFGEGETPIYRVSLPLPFALTTDIKR